LIDVGAFLIDVGALFIVMHALQTRQQGTEEGFWVIEAFSFFFFIR
jgi:hypothetical protein